MTPTPGRGRAPTRKRPRCSKCGKPIHVPAGWSPGSASRRHYWRKHREVMTRHRRRGAR